MNISIIKSGTEHAGDVSRICAEGWRQTVQGIYSEEEQDENVAYWYNFKKVTDDISDGIYTHVALVDGEVAGTIGGVMTNINSSEIYVFYIDEEFRYQGIGKKLLEAFTEEHMDNGATDQYASVQEGNDLGIPFYKARGFQQLEPGKYWRKMDS